ncbi:unnamed protein product [Prorocentrum cordatum]|uniref:Anaphase-promoting complex subunit 1 n=1 Tax=Prorocentrum cordatum TaxID=2364126 RepID=A0ABN9WVW1_9DINO|nr:unnamed protein product [Polarella glacialis]
MGAVGRLPEPPPPWGPDRLALFSSGRAEVSLSDGTGVIIHPGAQRVTYFRRGGEAQRLLSACLPRLSATGEREGTERSRPRHDDVRAKVGAAACLRNRFHPCPSAAPGTCGEGPRAWRHVRLGSARWPGASAVVSSDADAAIRVDAADGVASLVLAPPHRTYAVEWWCPLNQPCEVRGLGVPPGGEPQVPPSRGQRLFEAAGAAVGVLHEHALQRQCLLVAEPPPAAWAYPLLLALEAAAWEGGPAAPFLAARLEAVAAAVRRHEAEGHIRGAPAGGGVCAPLPCAGAAATAAGAWGSDGASPAAMLGAGGEGPVRVVWTPEATTWLHSDLAEATIVPSGVCEGSGQGASHAIASSLQGRFWSHIGRDGQLVEVTVAGLLPLDCSSMALSRLVADAARWLRHNAAEGAHAAEAQLLEQPAPASLELARDQVAPRFEHSEPGVGRVAVHGPAVCSSEAAQASRPLVVVQFFDGARVEFTTPVDSRGTPGTPTCGDTFRLLDPQGAVLRRTFGAPAGGERYARQALALLRRAVHPRAEDDAAAVSAVLAASQLRRAALLLHQRGVLGPELAAGQELQDHPEGHRVASLALPPSPDEALRRSRAACADIEATLGEAALDGGMQETAHHCSEGWPGFWRGQKAALA